MDKTSREVLNAKKRALSEGREAMLHHVGEGKDIMTLLCGFNLYRPR